MDKVKLPREDYEELRRNEESNPTYWKQYTLKMYLDHGCDLESPFETILSAMVHGYEVEETPEEQIRAHFLKHWDNQKTFSVDRERSKVICVTITNVLNTLNIKIVGVNHE